ncbi:DUF3800 domain-containing protein [Methylocystis sp. SB2]|uniref:DUF3800 domain-containing protein n=1 Tax=Methylocystis sp. (strain SB2) TaxID=743836 RepID=UPI0009FA61D9|nr:DUF3800 domain-containing protein [Methylocystis sp. SB2]ULO23883.1 DUF3800 domain-containing protein [Methylocystis sp. SB2]
MMLQAYIDDSGNDAVSPVFVLAGYLASIDEWANFTSEWKSVLDLDEPHPLRKFRMSDAFQLNNRNSVFFGFSEQDRDKRLQKLCVVPGKHVRHGIVSVIPRDLYKKYLSNKFDLEVINRPYFLSFFCVMIGITSLCNRLYKGCKVDFIFDSQDNEKKPILESQFKKFLSVAPDHVKNTVRGFPRFEKDDDFLPLQAADMLAWHVRRNYFEEVIRGTLPPEQRSNPYLAHLLNLDHDIFELWDENRLRDIHRIMCAIDRGKVNISPYGSWYAAAD